MSLFVKIIAIVGGLLRVAALVNAGAILVSAVSHESADGVLDPDDAVSCAAVRRKALPAFGASRCPLSFGSIVPLYALDGPPAPPAPEAPAAEPARKPLAAGSAVHATKPCPSRDANVEERFSTSGAAAPSAHASAGASHATVAAAAASRTSAHGSSVTSAADGPVREGAYWVETVKGIQTVQAGGTLRISSIGPVSLAGDVGKDVRYSVVKRVKASSEAEARRQLARFLVRSGSSGTITKIEIAHGSDPGNSAEIRVLVPRTLHVVGIETHGGDVDASGLDGGLVAATGGGRMKVINIGGGVEAKTAGGEIDLDGISGSVKCASAGGRIRAGTIGGEAAFQTGGGEIRVDEVGGLVRAVTAGGDILIRRAGGQVNANTAGGAIQIGEARGEVLAETLGGTIEIGSAAGVRCETAGGGIRLSNVSGRVSAETAVGNVVALLASGRSITDSYLATNAGDIIVKIPPGLPLTIRAEYQRAGARAITSDFPSIQIRNQGPISFAEGSINGGGPVLRLSALNGTIRIEKRQE